MENLLRDERRCNVMTVILILIIIPLMHINDLFIYFKNYNSLVVTKYEEKRRNSIVIQRSFKLINPLKEEFFSLTLFASH